MQNMVEMNKMICRSENCCDEMTPNIYSGDKVHITGIAVIHFSRSIIPVKATPMLV